MPTGSTARSVGRTPCLANLDALDSSQYVRIVERRDFYKWFFEHMAALGYSTRWALAANLVSNGAHQIADMDVDHEVANETLGLANVELQGVMREGNQVIFDNVLPKLKKLLSGGPLKGRAALQWDMQVLAEEQTLIQPLYSRMSKESLEQLDYLARKKRFAGWGASWTGDDKVASGPFNVGGTVTEFDQPDLSNVGDRWTYGTNLGAKFSIAPTGFDPSKDTLPSVGAGYTSGAELAKVNTRAGLHELDAWLNPNRFTRMGPGSTPASTYLAKIIGKLTPLEKMLVLSDNSPDGWSYSKQFAQFGLVTEALVRQALPSAPWLTAVVPASPWLTVAVEAFVARFKAESDKSRIYPPFHFGY